MKDMNRFRVVEHFISINGEGRRAGQLAVFIRFAGCNLNCEYCDTKWANEPEVASELYTKEEIYEMIKKTGVKNVTLTGGEPLLQDGMKELLTLLRRDNGLRVEIETNGSVDISRFFEESLEISEDNVSFTLDYKTAVSGMENRMYLENYRNVRTVDTVKFVVGSRGDLLRAKQVIKTYHLVEKGCGIYLSPCFGRIEPAQMVDFLIEEKMNDVNIQLQLHKFIWDPDKRGV